MDGENLADLYNRTQGAVRDLHSQATEIHELTKRLERLTQDTPAWYATTRAVVEARATLEQAEELRRVLEELGERLGTEAP
jgi:predicted YcjX-like family ATPase